MINNSINIFMFTATSKGLGINTDIFETNILNLSIVIGVLVYYGRVALGDIIRNRKENIIKNLQELEIKVRESEDVLATAKANLETAKNKAEQIRQQSESLSVQTYKSITCATEDDIKRLKSVNLLTLKMQEKKSLSEVCQKLSSLSFKQAKELLKKRLNSKFHKKIISRKIEKLSTLPKKRLKKKK